MILGGLGADEVRSLIASARDGSNDALGRVLELFRPYLLQIAFLELEPELKVKESPSDLVQQSFMEAAKAFGTFQGEDPAIIQDWLRQILLNNVRDLRDRYRTEKRRISREVGGLAGGVAGDIPADATPPSQVVIRQEQALALSTAMTQLTDDSRQLILLRHQEGRSFKEIAAELNTTEDAARKRWARAIEQLRLFTQEVSTRQHP